MQFVAAMLLVAGAAHSAPKSASATALDRQAMDTDYVGKAFGKAEQKLKRALVQCGRAACSQQLLGQLHRDLATVYISGTNQPAKGKSELKLALAADPDLTLDNDLTTPELRRAFVEAGGHLPKSDDKGPAEDVPPEGSASSENVVTSDAHPPPIETASVGQKNWLSVHFEQDFLIYSAQSGVCASNFNARAEAANYDCFQRGSPFGYTAGQDIQPGAGNQVSSGVGRATSRILLGFDRRLSSNFSVGLRLGVAFFGGPKSNVGSGFLPFHGEVRANYWFGADPFASSSLRPYVSISGGVAEVDGHVLVQYYALNRGEGTLDAWKKTGKSFAGLALGTMIPFAGNSGIVPELRAMELFGPSSLAFDVALGYAYGF